MVFQLPGAPSGGVIGSSVGAEPLLVRAYSLPSPTFVLNIAYGAVSNVVPKPACWNGSPANRATNSSERPGENKPSALTRPPSTVKKPLATTAPAPGAMQPSLHKQLDQPDGSAVPEKSEPKSGVSVTAPSPSGATL